MPRRRPDRTTLLPQDATSQAKTAPATDSRVELSTTWHEQSFVIDDTLPHLKFLFTGFTSFVLCYLPGCLISVLHLVLFFFSCQFNSLPDRDIDEVTGLLRKERWMNAATFLHGQTGWVLDYATEKNMFIIQSVATCSALVWLLFRAWQTLWKPVPELISVLGIEVPDAPELSLAGIKSDTIILHWSRPESNKPVLKYLIQVNGVNVGESARGETAITVTGLRPSHFYNVRVIAVGSNNFQAGSSVMRLRTYDKDGKPILDHGPNPSSLAVNEQDGESGDESHSSGVCVEATTLPESVPAMTRDYSGTNMGTPTSIQRRNTGAKRASPSLTCTDPVSRPQVPAEPTNAIKILLAQLDGIDRERKRIALEIEKEQEEFKLQYAEVCEERDEKKQILKEKEEASEKLKKEVNHAERLNRQAQNRKSQKEKLLREKKMERSKMEGDLKRWKKEIEAMRAEQEEWEVEKEKIAKAKQAKTAELQEEIKLRQITLNTVEEEIRVKGLQIKHLEQTRKRLPGFDDYDEARLLDEQEDREWHATERSITGELNLKSQQIRELSVTLHQQQAYLATLQQNNSIIYHGNSSGIDYDPGKANSRRARNRKSRTSTSSPISSYAASDPQFSNSSAYNINMSPAFAHGLYIDMNNDAGAAPVPDHMIGMRDEDVRAMTAGAPLSPTAAALLPSNIFADEDLPSPREESMWLFGPVPHGLTVPTQHEPQSPASSSRSASLMSSPRNSSQNLSMQGIVAREYGENDHRSMISSPRTEFGAIGSSVSAERSRNHKGFRDLFTLPRSRGKTEEDDGPTLGSLKSGQSQSFPRSIEETEVIGSRHRRISFSSGWSGFLHRATSAREPSITDGNAPAPARNFGAPRRRHIGMFASNIDEPSIYDVESSSSRPLSVASSDLPRPSTESAPFGWGLAQENIFVRNSLLANRWSLHTSKHTSIQNPATWSSNPSRRTSSQHGTGTVLTSGIASEEDEFLFGHVNPPTAIGVIGTRPSSSHQNTIPPKLNPAAPAFKGFSFTRAAKPEKEETKKQAHVKVNHGKLAEQSSLPDEKVSAKPHIPSRPGSRKSREALSIRTQNSLAESHESLECISSDSPSEFSTSLGSKEKEESSIHRLFRKGSSSKFSITSFRNKDSAGLFGGKKGCSSAANSDRNVSVERDSSFDEFGEENKERSVGSVTSSPMMSSIGVGEWTKIREKDKDLSISKEGRMGMHWGIFGLKGSKKGREGSDTDRGEDMASTEGEA